MMFQRLMAMNKNQLGFTLIEIMLVIAITGIITGGITTTIFQVFNTNLRCSNHMVAVRQVQSAGYWVSHDAQMAQQAPVIVESAGELESVTLDWTDWDGNVYQVIYTLEDMPSNGLKNLWRNHSVTDPITEQTTVTETGIIAQFIDPAAQTSCVWGGGVLVFTVTATVQQQSETRIYRVIPRPGS